MANGAVARGPLANLGRVGARPRRSQHPNHRRRNPASRAEAEFHELYDDYLRQIEDRKAHGLHPKPVDGADLLGEIVGHMEDADSPHRADCSISSSPMCCLARPAPPD